ncbi:hypothetical protein GPECTOR_18g49 [Gonium pectorale]|uniref:NADP-dependent oxidoreductase domain-containing protein n=1 Tax=Gonium pectorale TaxID=33097 RepID=A0A150GL49_GONPE|nr:hypothetical protein GPECTOR_18g49 [Gonium pectorale]|eukprot:KXZ50070.1 hypothetical protein GPECTOR_18g49 [Gonium pectorale]
MEAAELPQRGGGGGGGAPRRERRAWGPVPAVTLAKGLQVSKVIRGAWQLSGRHRGDPATDRTSGGEAVADMPVFHRAGVTTIDTADNYGPSEALIGQYLRLHPWQAASTTVATKLSYLTAEEMSGVNRTLVEYAVRSSLVRLGRQRLDLVQLQWADPEGHRKWADVLKWLAELREEGLIGHLGLCNFGVKHMTKAAELRLGLAAASYGIKLLAYGTVAGGLLADRYYNMPAAKARLDTASKQKYALLLKEAGGSGPGGGWGWMQEVLEATRAVAERHSVSASAVATAWVLAQPQVAAAIVGARNARHIRDMQAACGLVLDDGDMLDLDAVWEGVPNPPTSDVYVWERGGAW